jgi:NAD(P)-dependent dehydrogenase (short-subunit alcohol dehydrogenase family)
MAVCTIIGTGPGLGLAIARRFGRAGLAIGIIARKQETLAAAGEVVADAASIAHQPPGMPNERQFRR